MSEDYTLRLDPFDIVLLRPGAPHPIALGGTPVDLKGSTLTESVEQALLESSVRIIPSDLTVAAYDVVAALPVPACFERSGWLHDHHVLVLDSAADTELVRFVLDDVLGLVIEESQ